MRRIFVLTKYAYNMKRMFFAAIAATFMSCAVAQNNGDISLPAPDKSRGTNLMEALWNRQSVRECADRDLSEKDLADLLWAANGVNRADGKRTAPSAMNKQDIEVYAITAKGAYRYDASAHKLVLVSEGDHRSAVAGRQGFVSHFPVSLVLVSDVSKFGQNSEQARFTAAMDAGYVSQNICLFCSATGLVTVPRGSMDKDALKKVLKLGDNELPILNNPVGYRK